AVPGPDGTIAGDGRDHLSRQPVAVAGRNTVRDRRRAQAAAGTGSLHAPPAVAAGASSAPVRRGPARGGADRRSARDARRDARGDPPPVEPGVESPQAPADRPVRPTGAGRAPRYRRYAP